MDIVEKITAVRDRLSLLVAILERENERNWIRGVRAAKLSVTDVPSDQFEGAYEKARSIYRSMEAGQGSFFDYYIHRDESTERIRLNKELSAIKQTLWNLFDPIKRATRRQRMIQEQSLSPLVLTQNHRSVPVCACICAESRKCV